MVDFKYRGVSAEVSTYKRVVFGKRRSGQLWNLLLFELDYRTPVLFNVLATMGRAVPVRTPCCILEKCECFLFPKQ
jgi:hypothetical protein